MSRRYNSEFTMFVYLKGHNVLEYYFDLADARASANDWHHALPGRVTPITQHPQMLEHRVRR